MEQITSKDNKKIKHVLQLYKRKYRQTHREYVAEGYRTVVDMIPTGHVRYVLAKSTNGVEEGLQELCEMYHVDLYVVDDSLWKGIDATVHGQGVLAVVCQKESRIEDFTAHANGLYVLVDGVQDPGNMGTLIRTAVGAGVKAMFLTPNTVDVYNEKTVRSTMSGLCKIPIYTHVSDSDLKNMITKEGIHLYGTVLEDSVSYEVPAYEGPTMIALGNEANGLSQSILSRVEQRISIPMYGPMESLNVAIAGALCMYKVQERKLCLSKVE